MWSQQSSGSVVEEAVQWRSSGITNGSENASRECMAAPVPSDAFRKSGDVESTGLDGMNINLRDPEREPDPSYVEWLRTRVLRSRTLVYFSAFYFHWLVVLILAVIIIHGPETLSAISLVATVADPNELTADVPVLVDTEIEMPVADLPKPDPVSSQLASVLPSEQPLSELQMADQLLREFAMPQTGENAKASSRQFKA